MEMLDFVSHRVHRLEQSLSLLFESPDLLCTLVDAETRRYCGASRVSMEVLGVTAEVVLTHTTRELFSAISIKKNILNEKWLTSTEKKDNLVCQGKTLRRSREVLTDCSGFVRIINSTKVPILNNYRKIVLILNHAYESTAECDLLTLFQYYKYNYPIPSSAVQYFLKYLKIDHFFNELPTIQELQALIAVYLEVTRKEWKGILNKSTSKIDRDIEQLTKKLTSYSLEDIFAILTKTRDDTRFLVKE